MEYAFDSHFHLLPINHPSFLAYLSFVQKNRLDESIAVFNAKNYIVGNVLQNPDRLLNILAVMENKTDKILEIYEEDLEGAYIPVETTKDAAVKKIKNTLKEKSEPYMDEVSARIDFLPENMKKKAEKMLSLMDVIEENNIPQNGRAHV